MTSEIQQNPIHRYRLSDEAKEAIQFILGKLPRPTAANFADFIVSYFQVLAALAKDIGAGLHELTWPHGPSALILENCPGSDTIPETPRDGRSSPHKKQFIEEHFIVAIGLFLGRPMAYELEKLGELIANVIAVRGSEYKISNEGSLANLRLHVELAHYLALCPSYSILYCLRPDPWDRAVTVIVDVRDVISRLSRECLNEMRKVQYKIKLPASFAIDGGERFSVPTPLIVGPDSCPQVFAEFNSTVPLNKDAADALQELKQICETSDVTIDLKLKASESLILNNYRTLHGRKSFTPDWTRNSQRWLLRMNVVPDYWPYRHVMPAKAAVITSAFVPPL